MTEFSMLWETQTGTGDGINTYTQAQARFFFRNFTAFDHTTMGVLSGIDNELLVTGNASPLSVDTGEATVYGSRYQNDSSKAIALPGVAADTGGRIVLRADWLTNTVRSFAIQSASGVVAFPTPTQVPSTTWEIPLANYVQDSGGNVWTDASKTVAGPADARSFAMSPLSGMIRLRHFVADGTVGIVTWSSIQQDLSHLLVLGHGRSDDNVFADQSFMEVRFNLDAVAANYTRLDTITLGTLSVTPVVSTINTGILIGGVTNDLAGNPAGAADSFQIRVNGYSNSTFWKNVLANTQAYQSGATTDIEGHHSKGWWENTAAIHTMQVAFLNGENWKIGSQLSLYGIR